MGSSSSARRHNSTFTNSNSIIDTATTSATSTATSFTINNSPRRGNYNSSNSVSTGLPSLYDIGPDSSFSSFNSYSSSNTTTTTMTTPIMTNLLPGMSFGGDSIGDDNSHNNNTIVIPTTTTVLEAIGNGLISRSMDCEQNIGRGDYRAPNNKSSLSKLVLSFKGNVTRRNVSLLANGLESWRSHLKVLEIHNMNFSQGSFGTLTLSIQKLLAVSSSDSKFGNNDTKADTGTNTLTISSNSTAALESLEFRSCKIDDTCAARLVGGLLMNNLRPMVLHIERSGSDNDVGSGGNSNYSSYHNSYDSDNGHDAEEVRSSLPSHRNGDINQISRKTLLVKRLKLTVPTALTTAAEAAVAAASLAPPPPTTTSRQTHHATIRHE